MRYCTQVLLMKIYTWHGFWIIGKKAQISGTVFSKYQLWPISSRAKVISCKVSAEDREFNLEYVR